MLNIAVCDDERLYIDNLGEIILSFTQQNSMLVNIEKFDDGIELISSGIKFDLIFLDIEMKKSNGIEIAERIREVDSNVPIVYVTSYSDYWRRAYKVHAFDFILKPFNSEEIFKVLSDFIALKKTSNVKTVELTTEYGTEIQPINEIYYFILLAKRKIQIVTISKDYIVRENLTDIFNKLDDDCFYMTHRSCIVNMNYVQTIKKNDGILMTNGDWVPLAQKKQKDFFIKLSKQLRK
jgi:DNA-binding LytR/AlgR family response regulator